MSNKPIIGDQVITGNLYLGGIVIPQGKTITLTENGTFSSCDASMIIKINSDGAYELAPSGTFVAWTKIEFINSSAHTITLTATTPSQSLVAGGYAAQIFDGTNWF